MSDQNDLPSDQADFFYESPAQGSLFGPGRMEVPQRPSTATDPQTIRLRLKVLLEKARSAEKMPWSDQDSRMWQIVFPQMANWLPKDEAEQLRFEFAQEMERLSRAG